MTNPATPTEGNNDDQQQQAQPPATPNVVPPQAATAPTKPADGGDDSQATIERLEKDLKAARAEAAKSRVNAKQAAADEARKELAQQIGKALGIVEDDKLDPAELTEQLTAAKQSQTEAARELAVYKAAATAGADPTRLLDSRSFLASIKDVDPADDKAIAAAIKTTVDNNPIFKTTPAPGASSVDHAGGSGEGKPQKTLAEALQAHYGA